jgi:RNA polymerase sigma-70 factor, ECF subfamily
VVEHFHGKEGVSGSSPLDGSIKTAIMQFFVEIKIYGTTYYIERSMIKKQDCIEKDDVKLVKLALNDPSDFLCIVDRYEEKLLRYISRLAKLAREDAEDLLQEIFLKIYRSLNSYNEELKFSSWVYRIAHNETISYWRKNKNKKTVVFEHDDFDPLEQVSADLSLEKEINKSLTSERLMSTIHLLDKKYGEIIILYYYEQLSYIEIADVLKKNKNTVATLLARARKKLLVEIQKNKIEL